MKKFFLLSLSILLFACEPDNEEFVVPIQHQFEVTYNESYDKKPAGNAQVKLTSSSDGKTYSAQTNENGIAEVEVVPGTYKVSVNRNFTPQEYLDFAGQNVDDNIAFNASLDNLNITNSGNSLTEVELVTGRIGNLLIKQVYFAGSDVRLGASFRDQFIEIHNNSNELVYLDGLYFAQVYGSSSIPSDIKPHQLPNGQLDWSQSLGQQDPDNANSKYIYSDEVLQIPGTGEDYPLASGKSVIIAATAINHKAPLIVNDRNGEPRTYEVPEPDRTINLENAPFEAYFRPFQESQGSTWLDSDIDNPSSVNLEIAFKSFGGKDLILDTFGRDAYVIFRDNPGEINSWNAIPSPAINSDEFSESTSTYLQIPTSVIIDGVEVQRNDPNKAKPKRLPDAIDAGEISTISGKFSSESVIRIKTRETDGKAFYQDTNNSSVDFEVLDHPEVVID